MPLYTFQKFAERNAGAGVTVPQLRFQYVHRERNGLKDAFVRFEPKGPGTGVGRIYIDEEAYWAGLRSQSGRRAA